MIKYFCDVCGLEIKDTANRDKWVLTKEDPFDESKKVRIEVEAMVTLNGTTNGGHVCQGCIEKAVCEGQHLSRPMR